MPLAFHHRVFFPFFSELVGVDTGMPHLLDVNEFEHRLEIHQGEVNHHPPSAIRRDVAWPTAMEQHGKYPKQGQFGGSKFMGS